KARHVRVCPAVCRKRHRCLGAPSSDRSGTQRAWHLARASAKDVGSDRGAYWQCRPAFGYPEAHEDDAERAVRAGLELVAAVIALKTTASLQTRIGIACVCRKPRQTGYATSFSPRFIPQTMLAGSFRRSQRWTRRGSCHGSKLTHSTRASTTAFGCSGMSAWLALTRRGSCHGSKLTHSTRASTTAFGCSGMSAS